MVENKITYNGEQLIVELNMQGWINNKIGRYAGFSNNAIRIFLTRAGLESNKVVDVPYDEKEYRILQEIVELSQQEWTTKKIGEYMGIPQPTVSGHLVKLGIKNTYFLKNREYE